MAFMLTRIQVDDYDAWKPIFDSDPPGARKAAKGHRLLRSLEEPNDVFVQVEFGSPEDAKAARERLLASGVLERVNVKAGPTVAEEAETVSY
jgi:predicted nucleotidyltransferase